MTRERNETGAMPRVLVLLGIAALGGVGIYNQPTGAWQAQKPRGLSI